VNKFSRDLLSLSGSGLFSHHHDLHLRPQPLDAFPGLSSATDEHSLGDDKGVLGG
jgi:hypothetical protein